MFDELCNEYSQVKSVIYIKLRLICQGLKSFTCITQLNKCVLYIMRGQQCINYSRCCLYDWKPFNVMCNFRLLLQCKSDLHTFGIFCNVEWQFVADVLGQPIGPIIQLVCLKTSVINYYFTLHEIPEEQRYPYVQCYL